MAKQQTERCPGCGNFFKAKPGGMWCPACAAKVQTIGVEFTADEVKRLEAQAYVRGCDVPRLIREAVRLLTSREALAGKRNRTRSS